MDRLIYTALSGLRSAMASQAVTANNLANGSTVGFRRDLEAIEATAVGGAGLGTRIAAREGVLGADLSPGLVQQTGRPTDVALAGRALLAVQARDGSEGYTRRGDLRVTATGVLETGDGLPVLSDSGGIVTVPAAAQLSIGEDGTVSVQPEGGTPLDRIAVARLKLVTPEAGDLRKGLDGLMRVVGGGAAATDPQARLTPGSLEGSNVNPSAELVELIENSRAYEVQVSLLKSARDLDQSSSQLLRIDG